MKYIYCIVCFFMFVLIEAADARMSLYTLAGENESTGSACDTSNVIFWWRAEALDFSGTNGTLDYSAGDDTATTNGTPQCNATAVKYGTNGLHINSANEYIYFTTPAATIDDEGRFGTWLKVITWQNQYLIFRFYTNSDNYIKFELDSGDELEFIWRDAGTTRTAFVSTNANLATGTWYWIEAAWKTSTNYREIFVDGVSKGSSSATINSLAAAVSTLYIGELLGLGSPENYHDNIIISTDSAVDLHTTCKDELEWPE